MKYVALITALILLSGCKGGGGGGGNTDSGNTGNITSTRYTDAQADPLSGYLWHIKNQGQGNFAVSGGTVGADINMGDIHDNYRGERQAVVVSDGRIDLDHPDLKDNTLLSQSRNFSISTDSGVDPTSADDDDFHGTAVMGIIGAVRGNGQGLFGVAPKATLIGYNFLDSDQSLSKLIFQSRHFYGITTFNYSYGFNTCQITPVDESYITNLKYTVGVIYVTSGGNDFIGNNSNCGSTGNYLGNGNLDQVKSYPYYIVVAGLNANGVSSSYSTPSSNTWISAFGGEDYGTGLPLISTDLEGCTAGAASTASLKDFDRNVTDTNPNCSYATEGIAGTSFAAPMVTGAVALIREVCGGNTCNWRKVKYILAKSAKKNHPTASDTVHPGGQTLAGHTYQNGWITNAAGFNFHNWYGFGQLDVQAALTLAEQLKSTTFPTIKYTATPTGEYYTSGAINLSIPDNSSSGRSSTIAVNDHNLEIEHVQVNVNITHTYRADLGIELTSPSGTVNKIMNINSGISGSNFTNLKLGSNAFYGERARGNWTIKVVDGFSGDTGILQNWSLTFVGNQGTTSVTTLPEPVTNISNTGNTISWTPSASPNKKRYEACVIAANDIYGCDNEHWYPVGLVNSLTMSKFSITSWFNLSSGTQYKFHIRTIDENENESSIVVHTWTAI